MRVAVGVEVVVLFGRGAWHEEFFVTGTDSPAQTDSMTTTSAYQARLRPESPSTIIEDRSPSNAGEPLHEERARKASARVRALGRRRAYSLKKKGELVELRATKAPAPPGNQVFSSAQVWRLDPQSGDEYLKLVEARVVPSAFDLAVAAEDNILYTMLSEECQPATVRLPGGARAVKFIYSYGDAEMRPTQFQGILFGRNTIEGDRAGLFLERDAVGVVVFEAIFSSLAPKNGNHAFEDAGRRKRR